MVNHDGEWHLVFLGTRPRGVTPEFHVLGRETFAARVTWLADWPVVTDWLEGPAPAHAARGAATVFSPSANEYSHHSAECHGERPAARPLGSEWVAAGRFPSEFARLTSAGVARAAAPLAGHGPAALLRRQDAPYLHLSCELGLADGTWGVLIQIDADHSYRLGLAREPHVSSPRLARSSRPRRPRHHSGQRSS